MIERMNLEFAEATKNQRQVAIRKRPKQRSPLPPFEEFEEKFRRAFGRDMTREERRFYRLCNIVLEEDETEGATANRPSAQ